MSRGISSQQWHTFFACEDGSEQNLQSGAVEFDALYASDTANEEKAEVVPSRLREQSWTLGAVMRFLFFK
ncbi:MAG: hypothetical protein A3B31_02800 [Candidatus Komeilibacteria bacterium RIFCSPLOWO2_01_FULL_53_11]|uniref:Uncharacterized protein n=1 Tax=Candidatus Komeilibacteria bacterium RIFCSPLOWO2_01_FULL_53_11 TaxID=1798552 RepID=A0A1G2BX67_9BACT|nr:MAG: hypothetical protein A3B31_02800 [Candidatus Komeilibacteria bacterium RIFCSPLOWO2_01_FULL_53_11]